MATNGANADGTVPAKGGKILVLPGDHVGPEVVREALKILDIIEEEKGWKFERDHDLCGGCSLDKHKTAVTEDVLQKCMKVDAVFFGSAGGPEWGTVQPNPESGLLRIRDRMQVRMEETNEAHFRDMLILLIRSSQTFGLAYSQAKHLSNVRQSNPSLFVVSISCSFGRIAEAHTTAKR
jgi:hypothetical protein